MTPWSIGVMAIFHQLTSFTAGFLFVFDVLTSSSDSRALKIEYNSLAVIEVKREIPDDLS